MPFDSRRMVSPMGRVENVMVSSGRQNGVSFNVLDFGLEPQDNTEAIVVPEGRLFLMGDNRDNSMDSRFEPVANEGVGMVPVDNIVGRASFMFFSTDGTAEWLKPWTWFSAARWSRIGHGI